MIQRALISPPEDGHFCPDVNSVGRQAHRADALFLELIVVEVLVQFQEGNVVPDRKAGCVAPFCIEIGMHPLNTESGLLASWRWSILSAAIPGITVGDVCIDMS